MPQVRHHQNEPGEARLELGCGNRHEQFLRHGVGSGIELGGNRVPMRHECAAVVISSASATSAIVMCPVERQITMHSQRATKDKRKNNNRSHWGSSFATGTVITWVGPGEMSCDFVNMRIDDLGTNVWIMRQRQQQLQAQMELLYNRVFEYMEEG